MAPSGSRASRERGRPPPGQPREGACFKKNVLIEDAAAEGLQGHREDVPGDAEDEHGGEAAHKPGRDAGNRSFGLEDKETDGEPAQGSGPAYRRPKPAGPKDEEDKCDQTDSGHRRQDQGQGAGWFRYQGNGQEAERCCDEKPATFVDELTLFFLEGPQLVRIVDRVPDIAQGL